MQTQSMSQFETKPNKTGERTRQSFNKVEGDPFELFDFLFIWPDIHVIPT